MAASLYERVGKGDRNHGQRLMIIQYAAAGKIEIRDEKDDSLIKTIDISDIPINATEKEAREMIKRKIEA